MGRWKLGTTWRILKFEISDTKFMFGTVDVGRQKCKWFVIIFIIFRFLLFFVPSFASSLTVSPPPLLSKKLLDTRAFPSSLSRSPWPFMSQSSRIFFPHHPLPLPLCKLSSPPGIFYWLRPMGFSVPPSWGFGTPHPSAHPELLFQACKLTLVHFPYRLLKRKSSE